MELTPDQLRLVQLVAESGLFDEAWYRETYRPALAATNLPPIVHLLALGRTGAFDPGPEFDCRYYLELNPDVAASGMHPLLHYLHHGRREGRARRAPPEAAARAMFDARARGEFRGSLLIVDDVIPYPQLGAGYPRSLDMLKAAVKAGWWVTFYPLMTPVWDRARASRIVPPQVEIAAERGVGNLPGFLRERRGCYDAALVSRPHNMELFRSALAEVPDFIALSRVIYDAEAIFAMREAAKAQLAGQVSRSFDKAIAAETALSDGVGAVTAVNALEAAAFRGTCSAVRVLGHALELRPTTTAFADRRDLLFVGALDDDAPNADSLDFFVRQVMPELDRLIGADWVLRVAGRNAAVRGLGSERVQLLGPVEDVTPLYAQSRVFIAPTRYAAGIPRKVHEAAAHGLPTVVTSLLARQLGWAHGEAVLVADAAADFARACQRLYQDAAVWETVRAGALAKVAADCSPEAFQATLADALELVAGR